MKRINQIKIDDAKYYEKIWSEEFNTRPYYDAVRMRALIRNVKNGDSVMDIGAGVFGACQYIAEKTALKCDLFAYDQSYTAMEIVNRVTPQIDYQLGECAGRLPFEDNSFDVVMAGEVIEHMEDPAAFCAELCRISRQWVSLSTVDTNCANAIKHGEYPEHIWEFTPEDLVSFFEPFGVVTYEVVGDYHFIYFMKQW